MTITVERVSEALEAARSKLDEATSSYHDERVRLQAQMDKLQAWLWANSPQTAETVVQDYVGYRDERSALKKVYETEDEAIKERMALRENWLLRMLQSVGGDGIRTAYGTAFIKTNTKSSCSDWPSYWAWIKEHDRFDGLEKRVSQGMISKMVEDGIDTPPGINLHQEQTVQVRRS